MTKSVDADEVQLKYMVHVFSGSSEKELLFFLQTPNVQHAKWSGKVPVQVGSGK